MNQLFTVYQVLKHRKIIKFTEVEKADVLREYKCNCELYLANKIAN